MDTFSIKGLDGVLEKMRTLSPKLQKKGLRTAVRKGATVFKKAIIENAKRIDDPATAENISKNVAVQFSSRLSKREGGIAYRVGILGGARIPKGEKRNQSVGKKNPGGDTRHFRFIEFGTSKVGARPFIQPAMTQNASKATDVIVETLNKEIDKAVK